MGYQERDYYRDDENNDPLGIRTLSMTTKIIIVTAIVYLVDLFLGGEDHKVTEFLALEANWFTTPYDFYQLLTHGFAHDPRRIQHILFNMLGLWFFGRLLEERWGGAALLRFYLVSIVFCGLVWSARHFFLLNEPLARCVGASGGVTAVVILFCLLSPQTRVLFLFFPMPAWTAGLLIVLMDMAGVDFKPAAPGTPRTAFDAHLAGAFFALVVWGLKINFTRWRWLDEPTKWLRSLKGWFKSRPNLRVHSDAHYHDEDDDLADEADRILAKITTHGDASLTAKERRTLEKYSRLMRDKQK